MKYNNLGSSGLKVSEVCLGTMTWGEQNTESQAHEQMDYAVTQGINFFDTAEMYAVPPSAATYTTTETIIGNWFEKTGKRKDIILASKVSGGGRIPWVRDAAQLTRATLTEALDGSLKRLKTDYLDLYQIHWPQRKVPHLAAKLAGRIDFAQDETKDSEDQFLDILRGLDDAVKAGKVRHVGLSNETPWGLMKHLELAKQYNLPRMVSMQNEYSILVRSDDPYLAEVCVRENVAYLPWSPLTRGMISGKYRNGVIPEGTRWAVQIRINPNYKDFRDSPEIHAAIDAYISVAEKHNLDVCQMALAFCRDQRFVTSTIIGATTMEQLKSNIAAFDLKLNQDVLSDIDEVYRHYPLTF